MIFPLAAYLSAGGIFLEGNWIVICRGKEIGRCTVAREGLYYRFSCRCRGNLDRICCLIVQCGETRENLGVLVPLEGGFGLDTRLPVKRFPLGKPEFAVTPKKEPAEEKFIPVLPEEPFAYLSRLQDAYLERRGEIVGIVLK